jgi:hypothetical protein
MSTNVEQELQSAQANHTRSRPILSLANAPPKEVI